jgi:pimeloyl-ACP methyl ester carboxylesterase
VLSTFADGRIFGETYGSAPAKVVALHGWARTHDDWTRVLAGFDAVALDLPGFGVTPEPTEPWGSPEYAALVADVLRALPAPTIVVGHSLGGRVGVHLAATYPELVGGLLLTGAPLIRVAGKTKPRTGYRLTRWLHQRGVISEARMETARQKYGSSDYANASPAMRAVHVTLVNENYDAQIAGVRCPTRLVWGEGDTAAPVAAAHDLARRLDTPLTVVAGAGHMTPLTAVDELRAAIKELM